MPTPGPLDPGRLDLPPGYGLRACCVSFSRDERQLTDVEAAKVVTPRERSGQKVPERDVVVKPMLLGS
ncbi:MAG: hypothetical protein EOO77_40695 [Oxalobacteraceae bacterium]|nr:MAG: hypothetical protein EOO77_40695 [Oxalobacteraceae bacterium]